MDLLKTIRLTIIGAVMAAALAACAGQSSGTATSNTSSAAPVTTKPSAVAPDLSAVELLKPTGRFAVGTVRFTLTDADRKDAFAKGRDVLRRIAVQVWYPADAGAVSPAAVSAGYMLPEQSAFMISEEKDRSYRFPKEMGNDWAARVKVHSFTELPVAGKDGRLPLLLYSPGLHSLCALGQHYLEGMASQGFVVAGVDSPGVCGAAVLPGGEVVVNAPVPPGMSFYESLRPKFAAVLGDVVFTLDALEKSDGLAAGSFLHRRLDFGRVGMFGISFGGGASAVLAMREPRIKAAASMEGPLYAPPEVFNKPFMLFAGGAAGDRDFRALSGANAGPSYLVTIPRARHENFGDVSYLSGHFYPGKEWQYPNIGAIDHEGCTAMIRTALVSFFRAYLDGGDPAGVAECLKDSSEAKITVE